MFVERKVLVIDAGNTRVKYIAFHDDCILWHYHDLTVEGLITIKKHFIPDFVYFASVRTLSFGNEVRNLVMGVFPESGWLELDVQSEVLGVKNAYIEPHRLGVDRWLGLVAAYIETKGNVVLLDAGTAIKIDVVSIEGVHLGGYITPGLAMMEEVLLSKTARIRYTEDEVFAQEGLPNSTARAVTEGVSEMVLGFVERIFRQYSDYTWLVTGGDAEQLMAMLDIPFSYRWDIVATGAKLIGDERLRCDN